MQEKPGAWAYTVRSCASLLDGAGSEESPKRCSSRSKGAQKAAANASSSSLPCCVAIPVSAEY